MTIRDYLNENYCKETLRNIRDKGCSSGAASTLIYYHDTAAFYDQHEAEIWKELDTQSNETGENILLNIVEQFEITELYLLKNHLCWWAVEVIAGDMLSENASAKQEQAND
jgi:hypothetical protein